MLAAGGLGCGFGVPAGRSGDVRSPSYASTQARRGRAAELAGCLLKEENEEKCREALFCCTEGLKRCCAAVIQWGKDKSLTYTYAPPRERTPWAEKEQNMKYEFPRAAQEGWLSRALPPLALHSLCPAAQLCLDEGLTVPREGPQAAPSLAPAALVEGKLPSHVVLGCSSHPRRWVKAGRPSLRKLAAPAGSSPGAEGGGGGGPHYGKAWKALT